jgi:hypothetical protein
MPAAQSAKSADTPPGDGELARPPRTAEGLRHQPGRLPGRHPGQRGVRDQLLPDLWRIEKSFRMSKHDLQARPVYHHQRESIDAHLTIVFAALSVSRWIEQATGWSIKKFVKTARRYRTIEIQAGNHVLTAADPLTSELHEILGRIYRDPSTH